MEILSADSSIRGDEKYQQIENIRGKIRSLADTLGIEYKTEGSASQSETKQPEAVEDGESTGREQIEFHIE